MTIVSTFDVIMYRFSRLQETYFIFSLKSMTGQAAIVYTKMEQNVVKTSIIMCDTLFDDLIMTS